MKKVMIGILILIPIIVLVVVALVSVIVSVNAHIAVEDLQLLDKNGKQIYDLQIPFDEVSNINIYNYLDAKIYPEKATDKTVEWQIVGDVAYTDVQYEALRNEYLAKRSALTAELENELVQGSFSTAERRNAYDIARGKYYKNSSLIIAEMADILLEKVYPAAAFVDENGNEVESNTTGKLIVSSYCKFTVRAQAETVSKTLTVSVVGYDVERVELSVGEDETTALSVGESMRILASYTPIDSIVNHTIWQVEDESVAVIDSNGVITALKEGQTTVILRASVYSTENGNTIEYVEGKIDISVEQKGASSRFGENLVTSRKSLTFEEIGVVKEDITSVNGVPVDAMVDESGRLKITENIVVITVKSGAQLTIASCVDDDVTVNNRRFYENGSGYVLAVGENLLDLDLVWKDMLKTDQIENAVWSSSNESVATVNDLGEVKGVSSGVVTITATVGQKSTSITINVQRKLSQIQLRTSDASLAIGIARETVFASERYIDVKASNAKTANYTHVIVQGEPENATAAQLADFYSAYVFEIVEGGEYASMDTLVANKVVFNDSLEGKGKQKVVVKVSARYPKYEGMTRFTTETVTLNVVYGVAVYNFDELKQATLDQGEYALADGNVQDDVEIFRNETENEAYVVNKIGLSNDKYAICLFDNCKYNLGIDENGQNVIVDWKNCLKFTGDVYGNNKRISANTEQLDKDSYIIQIDRPDVTLSNLIIRGNDIDDEYEITDAEDTSAFEGNILRVGDEWKHFENIRIEYSIIENGSKGINVFSTDLTIDGCIIRNITKAAMYVPTRMSQNDGETDEKSGKKLVNPCYSHLTFNNVICSNTLGSLVSVAYEHYTMKSGTTYRFVVGNKKNDADGSLAQANEKYFIENFYDKGINTKINQTGFLWAYNWQNLENAKLIQTSNEMINSILSVYFKPIVQNSAVFDDYRYVDQNSGKEYLHLAFIVTGIDFAKGILDAPTYLELSMEEKRINGVDISDADFSKANMPSGLQDMLEGISVKTYGYDNKSDINPLSPSYQVNNALIEKIHS